MRSEYDYLVPVAGEAMKPEPSRYTHPRDWMLDGNRPRLSCEDDSQATTNKARETGLIVRQPL